MWEFLQSYGTWVVFGVAGVAWEGTGKPNTLRSRTSWLRREKRVTAVRAEAATRRAVDYHRAMQRVGQTPLLLAAGLWLCTLPVVLLLAAPFIGAGRAWTVAALILVAFLAICLGLCDQRIVARRRPENGKG